MRLTCAAINPVEFSAFFGIQKLHDFDLDFGSCQGHISMHNSYQHAQPSDCSVTHYRNMAIWISWNIDIPRSLNSRDSFLKRKFDNRARASCRLGPVLSRSTISFELHAKMVEQIDIEKCNFRQCSQPMTLTLTLDRAKVTWTHTVRVGIPACQPCDCSVTHYRNMVV